MQISLKIQTNSADIKMASGAVPSIIALHCCPLPPPASIICQVTAKIFFTWVLEWSSCHLIPSPDLPSNLFSCSVFVDIIWTNFSQSSINCGLNLFSIFLLFVKLYFELDAPEAGVCLRMNWEGVGFCFRCAVWALALFVKGLGGPQLLWRTPAHVPLSSYALGVMGLGVAFGLELLLW